MIYLTCLLHSLLEASDNGMTSILLLHMATHYIQFMFEFQNRFTWNQ